MKLTYHIGKETKPLDTPPFRVYFSWINENNQIAKSEDYSIEELKIKISKMDAADPEHITFKQAMQALSNE